MRLFNRAFQIFLLGVVATIVAGCGGSSDPAAGLDPEKMASAPEKLGDNPDYAKQFGSGENE